MPELARKIESESKTEKDTNRKGGVQLLQEQRTPELVIALCGPIGSPLHETASRLKVILEDNFGYSVPEPIRLSKFIKNHYKDLTDVKDEIDWSDLSSFSKKEKLIEIGNKIRERNGNDGILAQLAVRDILFNRIKKSDPQLILEAEKSVNIGEDLKTKIQEKGRSLTSTGKTAYIIDSIKNQAELDIFRLLYRDLFYFIGVYSPLEDRIRQLEGEGIEMKDIYKLIDRDSGEETEHGQTVRNTFPQADFFLRVDSQDNESIKLKLRRFLKLIFESEILTPTFHETAMYAASTAAKNSACLSRQVGAALTDKDGEIISLGWNDVPKYGGGIYQTVMRPDGSIEHDGRCFFQKEGKCYNDEEKNYTSQLIFEAIKGYLKEDIKADEIINIIRGSKIKSLVEFSRSIHAEMNALISGCITAGHKVKDGKMFITTYPCHMCARHLIMGGIKEIYYLEPYKKSLTMKLHFDSITETDNDKDHSELVKIKMFEGVGPNRYLELFQMRRPRKKDITGEKIDYLKKDTQPKESISLHAIPTLESLLVTDLII